ncbi:MAG: polyprenyl synthetase family protein [Kiritimatiellaeota bacterium]|nr:polyprenyl synthetase family protein [Kiritimatiellota bacterium]
MPHCAPRRKIVLLTLPARLPYVQRMPTTPMPDALQRQLAATRSLIKETMTETTLKPRANEFAPFINGGKMLRASLVFRVGAATGPADATLRHAAAAVEMIHAASLLHDDVIDGGTLRRGAPSFWVANGTSGAILLGDLLFFKAIHLVRSVERGRLLNDFVNLAGEVCEAESEQELLCRRQPSQWRQIVSIARRKTGGLFAFAALAAAGRSPDRQEALREAGYLLGTAYQLADDLLDVAGNPHVTGKTSGTDRARAKATAAGVRSGAAIRRSVAALCRKSAAGLNRWPAVRRAWSVYLAGDIQPTLHQFLQETPS